ncbi:MAG: hypothetical protein ACLGSD_14880 [Acidobacteriota bacterium]
MRRYFVTLGIGLLCLFGALRPVAYAQDQAENPGAACARKNLKKAVNVEGYIFASYQNEDDGACLRVILDHRIIFQRSIDNRLGYELGQPADKRFKVPAIRNGADVTGRGNPDMIVSYQTGGAHCCGFHYVFELKPRFRLLATLSDRDDDLAHFEDLDGDGHFYYITADWTFAYWNSSFAGSPNHGVILRWQDDTKGGGFHLALEKMYRPAPSDKDWNSALNQIREDLKLQAENRVNFLPTDLWQEILALLYTGHSDLAWKFLSEAGPKAQQDPYPDLADFCSQLKRSPYWLDLEPTLKNVPEECSSAKSSK